MEYARLLARRLAVSAGLLVLATSLAWLFARAAPGADADVTLFDDRLEVCMTIVMGRVVYQR